jgi:hypothetical protein
VKQNGDALEFASDELQGDREVVLAAVKQNGDALKYASQQLRGDREVVKAAVEENADALTYALGNFAVPSLVFKPNAK